MPACKSFGNSDQFSPRHRCTMRGKKLHCTVPKLLEAKSSRSRSTRQRGSIIIEFRRWLIEFWNSVVNRLKGVFLIPRNFHSPRSLTSKTTNMDADRENAFWREGGLRYIHKNDYLNIRRNSSYTTDSLENRDCNSRTRNFRNAAPIYYVGCKNNQWPKSRRGSSRKIANFTATESTDEEYFALYKKPSLNKNKSGGRNFGSSSGDCIVEPIETILSRYKKKSPKSPTELMSGSSMEALDISDQRKSTENLKSLWYSKSELNITPERKSANSTRKQISRIPRLRHLPEKKSAKAYRMKNDVRPNSICQ